MVQVKLRSHFVREIDLIQVKLRSHFVREIGLFGEVASGNPGVHNRLKVQAIAEVERDWGDELIS
jgi:hypothetical protein